MSENKILVSKEVAAALKSVLMHNTRSEIVTDHVGPRRWAGEWAPIGQLCLDELIHALYIGYEAKKTPEEKVKELFDSYGPPQTGFRHHQPEDKRVQMGIRMTLSTLGMKVEGINDDNN